MKNNFKFLIFVFFVLLFLNMHISISSEIIEKEYVNVTLSQDFSLNSICVIMQNEESISGKEYNVEDFQPLIVDRLIDNDEYTFKLINKIVRGEIPKNDHIVNLDNYKRSFTLEWDNDKSKEEIIDIIHFLEQRDDIFCVLPNYFYDFQSSPIDDPFYYNYIQPYISHDIDKAWSYTTGSHSIKVGIIDTGICGTHPDLISNINNGLHKDFVNPYSGNALIDNNGHGTKVAGIIGSSGNNSIGMRGVCWDVSLVSLKVFDVTTNQNNGHINSSLVVQAVNYARTNNIGVLNFSGILRDDNFDINDYNLYMAISNYSGLFICSAGNDDFSNFYNNSSTNVDYRNNDVYPKYPADYSRTLSNVISVGGIDLNDNLMIKSSENTSIPHIGSYYGQNSVSLFAVGRDIFTTTNDDNDWYDSVEGTSFSTAIVTATAALMLSIDNSLSSNQIKSIILNSTDSILILYGSYLSGQYYYGKKLNVLYAIYSVINGIMDRNNYISNYEFCTFDDSFYLSNNSSTYNNKKFFEFSVLDEGTYIFYSNASVTLYDENFNEIYTNNVNCIGDTKIYKYLYEGTYCLKVETNKNNSSLYYLSIYNKITSNLSYNSSNYYVNTDLECMDFKYNNLQNSSFYRIMFIPKNPIGGELLEIPDKMLEIYNDIERTSPTNKTNSLSATMYAYTTASVHEISVYMEHNKTYYFDIEYNISDMIGFEILILPITSINIDNISTNVFSNTSCSIDNVKKLIIENDVEIQFDILYSSNTNNSIQILIFKEETIGGIKVNTLVDTVSANSNITSYNSYSFEEGIYYIGNISSYGDGLINVSIELIGGDL